ncbi:MAG: phospholipase D-like domain-containing protein [Planctomycetota bacterium]|jgi:hypothetical protein
MLEFITDRDIYEKVICGPVPKTHRLLWIATADLKDLHVHKSTKMVPFLEILSDLVNRHVEIRLLHAKEPGPAFRKDFDRYPNLIDGMERILCPRVHLKTVIVDAAFAYIGSANLTGAGMGANRHRRQNHCRKSHDPVRQYLERRALSPMRQERVLRRLQGPLALSRKGSGAAGLKGMGPSGGEILPSGWRGNRAVNWSFCAFSTPKKGV